MIEVIVIIINPLRDSPYPVLLLPCALCTSTHVHVISTWYMSVLYLCASLALCLCEFGTLAVLIVDMSALSLVSVCMSDTWLFPTLLSQSGGVCLARSLPLRAWHFGFLPVKQLLSLVSVCLYVRHVASPNAATPQRWIVPCSLFAFESLTLRFLNIVSFNVAVMFHIHVIVVPANNCCAAQFFAKLCVTTN